MVEWLQTVCEIREPEAKRVTEGLAQKGNIVFAADVTAGTDYFQHWAVEQMMTTTKQTDFLDLPLQDCRLNDVPGVGQVIAKKLENANIDTPIKLMGQFLLMGMEEAKMVEWLQMVCEIREPEAKRVTERLAQKGGKAVIR